MMMINDNYDDDDGDDDEEEDDDDDDGDDEEEDITLGQVWVWLETWRRLRGGLSQRLQKVSFHI